MSKHSFNSSLIKNELFATIFSDRKETKAFSCGERKCSYLENYGIVSYFLELLNIQLVELKHFVTLYDESNDKVEKQRQMDLHIRFLDNSEDIVATRYFSSEFLRKAGATDICVKFEKCLGLKILWEKRRDENLKALIYLGTCALPTVHKAFKHGEVASGWKKKKLISSLQKIFDESLSCRADYKNITESNNKEFPTLFVIHELVENEPVAKETKKMWPKIAEFVKY